MEWRQLPRLRARVLCRSGAARGVPAGDPARGRGGARAVRGRSYAACVPDPAAGRGHQARHHRRAAQRDQARSAPPGPVLRHALRWEPAGAGTVRAEPLHGHPAASLQPGRGAAGAGHRAVHQRAAGVHVRAEEQPHQADGGRRGPAVPAGSQPAREVVRVRAVHRALRRGRARGAVLHPARRQGVVVPAVQPGLERRRGQPAQPERAGDRLPVAGGAASAEPHQHPGELRPGGGGEGREERQEAADPDLAALPSARRGAPAAGRRRRPRRGPALPDPALGRQRQEQLHRLAGPPTDRADQGRRAGLRLDHRGHRPGHPRPSDPRHDPAVRAGGGDGRARRPLGRSAPVHRERQEDHHLHGPEVSVHPGRDRQRAARAQLRDHHRRGALQPGRPHQRGHDAGALGGGRGRRGGDLRGPDQPRDGVAQAAGQRQLLRVHGHAQEQDAGDLRRPRTRSRTAASGIMPSTATP